MSWSTITADNVLEEFTEAERAAVTAEQSAVDNLPTILARTIGMARGMISAGGNQLDAAGTLPDQVIPDVIAIARYRLLTGVPKLRALITKERKDAHDEAMKRFENIASGSPKVEPPANPITTESTVPGPSFGTRGGTRTTDPDCREFTRSKQDGL